ncbi:MAG TPA: hypothetical protein VF808_18920 [Ktedonobacterales bacterium]
MERAAQEPVATGEVDASGATKRLKELIRDYLHGFINLATMPRALRLMTLGGIVMLGFEQRGATHPGRGICAPF